MYGNSFPNLSSTIFEICVATPQCSFWIPTALAKVCLPCIVINRVKNTFVLIGTVVKKHEFFRPSRDAQNVCAITKRGTVLNTNSNLKKSTKFLIINVAAYSIGCFKDTGRRAISPLEGRSRLLRGHYRRRRYAIQKCALAAQRRGYRVFAVQHGGWCASTKRAHLTYRRYGKSNRCRNGKGGPWANDVYVLRGKNYSVYHVFIFP